MKPPTTEEARTRLVQAAQAGDFAAIQSAFDSGEIDLAALHEVRQRYHRVRRPRLAPGNMRTPGAPQCLAELEDRGITRLPGWVSSAELRALRSGFQDMIQALNRKILRRESVHQAYDEEENWWPNDRAYISNNAFKYSSLLVKLCCRPELLEVVHGYVGTGAIVTRGVAMRYLPDEEKHSDMFGWHHDMEERRLKMLILLTDVGPADQHMSYVRGSHAFYHPLDMYYENTCSLEYCRQRLGDVEIIHATGQAGDVFLFDSNGAHRGNRKPAGATRDTFFIEYSTDRSDVWGGDLPEGCPDELARTPGHPFTEFITAAKKWDAPVTRSAPAWIENLAHVTRWR